MKKLSFFAVLLATFLFFFAIFSLDLQKTFANVINVIIYKQENPSNELHYYFLPSCLYFFEQPLSLKKDEVWLHDTKAKKTESKILPVVKSKVDLKSLLDPVFSFKEAVNYQLILKEKAERYGLKRSEVELLSKIASSESNFRQYSKKGKILRGRKNPRVVGIFQIHEKFHRQMAENLGLDIYKPEGNIEYAIFLFKEEGIKPWRTNKKVLLAYSLN